MDEDRKRTLLEGARKYSTAIRTKGRSKQMTDVRKWHH